MTFMHKLSRRLAMLKDRWVVFSTAALALATLSACEKPIALTGPDASAVWRLVISPKILTLRQNQTADFTAIGLTDRKSTRLNSSHSQISYAVFCLKKKRRNLFSRFNRRFTLLDLLVSHLCLPSYFVYSR